MNEIDRERIAHMLEAAREVVEFSQGSTRDSLETDRKTLRALSMSIALIGEAAAHLSEELRNENSQIPWRSIIAMRNFVMHEYFRIEVDILWETTVESIPTLITELEKLLPPEEADET